jgi:anthranilate synthase component 1
MTPTPDLPAFARIHRAEKNQTVSTVLTGDMETPVSAALKLGRGKPYSFLLESMEGGVSRGRYSIIGRAPDLIWRCDAGGKVSVNRDALENPSAFVPVARAPLLDLIPCSHNQ